MNEYHPIPQPDEIPVREREDAMGAYLMMFAAIGAGLPLPILNLIAAVIYYFIHKNRQPFVHFHALQAMLSQLPTSIMNAVAVFWTIRIFLFDWDFTDTYKGYLIMLVVANLLYFVFSIVAAVRARQGRLYYLMFFGRLSYDIAFAKKEKQTETPVNLPPR